MMMSGHIRIISDCIDFQGFSNFNKTFYRIVQGNMIRIWELGDFESFLFSTDL